jgi:hypothetical protein
MSPERVSAALRHGLSTAALVLAVLAAPVLADEAPSPIARPNAGLLRLIPRQIHVPDVYSEPAELLPTRHVGGFDADRVVSFDLLPRPRRGWMVSLAYDEETRGPLPEGGDTVSVVFEFRF